MDAANPWFDKIESETRNAYQPYTEWGKNPAQQYEQQMQSYQESPSQRMMRERGIESSAQAARAGGYTGSHEDQINQGSMGNFLDQQNQQQYRDNLYRGQMMGLQGAQGQNNDLTNLYGTRATMGYQDAKQKEKDRRAKEAAWLRAIGAAGGFALGGPWGAGIGAGLGNALGGGDTGGNQDFIPSNGGAPNGFKGFLNMDNYGGGDNGPANSNSSFPWMNYA